MIPLQHEILWTLNMKPTAADYTETTWMANKLVTPNNFLQRYILLSEMQFASCLCRSLSLSNVEAMPLQLRETGVGFEILILLFFFNLNFCCSSNIL